MPDEARLLHTDDGLSLEAEVRIPDEPWASAVLCHPHPMGGGSMHTIVPATLFEALPRAGVAALRFNFRGVGRSGGTHDEGRGEQRDIVAAIDALAAEVPNVPLFLTGWSFGAETALAVGDARVTGWVAVAAPLSILPADDLVPARDPRPALLLVPEHDQFRDPSSATEVTASWPNTRIVVVAGADHFFRQGIDDVATETLAFIQQESRG